MAAAGGEARGHAEPRRHGRDERAARQRDAEARRQTRPPSAASRRVAPPLEHRVLLTATLCLLAFGAVMIYSASSPVGAAVTATVAAPGQFLRYIVFVVLGLGTCTSSSATAWSC